MSYGSSTRVNEFSTKMILCVPVRDKGRQAWHKALGPGSFFIEKACSSRPCVHALGVGIVHSCPGVVFFFFLSDYSNTDIVMVLALTSSLSQSGPFLPPKAQYPPQPTVSLFSR